MKLCDLIDIILVCGAYAYVLFDIKVFHSFISILFSHTWGLTPVLIDCPLTIATLLARIMISDLICKSCELSFWNQILIAILIFLEMTHFDVILVMDLLYSHYCRLFSK